MDIIVARLPSQVDQYPGGGLPSLGEAEAAVADLPTWRTHPLFVQQCLPDALPIAVEEAWPTELPPQSLAVPVVADGLGVHCLLSALVTGGAVSTVVDLVRAPFRDIEATGGGDGWLAVQLDG